MVKERPYSNDRKKDYPTPYPEDPKKKASDIHLERGDLDGFQRRDDRVGPHGQ